MIPTFALQHVGRANNLEPLTPELHQPVSQQAEHRRWTFSYAT
jgi:hypothetical protein